MAQRRPTRETEATLLVVPEHRRSTLAHVAGLTSVAGYRLGRSTAVRIEDTYFDTPDGVLRRARLALRLRKVDGRTLVALKGQPVKVRGGAVRRLEMERPWSTRSAKEVLAAASRYGVSRPGRRFLAGRPQQTMTGLGFAVIQRRGTLRLVREMVARSGEVVAELDIDAVTYRLGSVRARLHELEIEAHSRSGEGAVAAAGTALLRMLPRRLERWPHSKLATGRVLQLVAETDGTARIVDKAGNLTAETLGRVRARLTRRGTT